MHPSRSLELLPDRLWWLLQTKRDRLRTVTTQFEAFEDERFRSPGVTVLFHKSPLTVALFLDAKQHIVLQVSPSQPNDMRCFFAIENAYVINQPERILAALKATLDGLPISIEVANYANWEPIQVLWQPLLIQACPAWDD